MGFVTNLAGDSVLFMISCFPLSLYYAIPYAMHIIHTSSQNIVLLQGVSYSTSTSLTAHFLKLLFLVTLNHTTFLVTLNHTTFLATLNHITFLVTLNHTTLFSVTKSSMLFQIVLPKTSFGF